MKKIFRVTGKVLLILLAAFAAFLMVMFVYNQIMLKKEAVIFENPPVGQFVEVDGHNMCIYTEGEGDHTLVFLAGSGISSPIYDFKSLYSLLSDDYRIVVVEKFGYGFSDVVEGERSISTILRQDREALALSGIEGPFILCPHSFSALEALMWAQQYPDEVEAIVGLDMAVPQTYENYDPNNHSYDAQYLLVKALRLSGICRLFPDDVLLYTEGLTEEDIQTFRQIMYARLLNETVMNEGNDIPEVSEQIMNAPQPDIPMLLFVADGGEADVDLWRRQTNDFVQEQVNASVVELDCGHLVYDFEQERIAADMRVFIENLDA